jgi:hypothetical protein
MVYFNIAVTSTPNYVHGLPCIKQALQMVSLAGQLKICMDLSYLIPPNLYNSATQDYIKCFIYDLT